MYASKEVYLIIKSLIVTLRIYKDTFFFKKRWKLERKNAFCKEECAVLLCSVASNSVTAWTVAHQAPLSLEFSKQEYWSGLPFSTPGDLPHPGIETSFVSLLQWQVDSLPLHHLGSPPPSSPLWTFCLLLKSTA